MNQNSHPAEVSRAVQVLALVGAVVFVAGGVVALVHPATLVPAHESVTAGVRDFADRFAAAEIAIGLALVVCALMRSAAKLSVVVAVAVLAQCGDAIAGVARADGAQTSGAAVIVIGYGWILWRLSAGRRLRASRES